MVLFQYLKNVWIFRVFGIRKPDVAQMVGIIINIAVGYGSADIRSPDITLGSREEL